MLSIASCRRVALILASACVLAASAVKAANEEATRIGGVDVVVWTSSAPSPDAQPVVVFSHGMSMCPTQSRYLTRAVADAGYLVIAPRHSDSNCRLAVWPDISRLAWKPSLLWSDSDFRDRADDVRRLLRALAGDARFRGVADPARLALVGHTLGGYTVLGLGGAWPSWRLPGVRAIVALTPYSLPFQRSGGLRTLTAPVMYQAGTLDPVFTVPLELSGGGYAQTPPPKYLVEIDGAAHMAWTDLGFSGRDAIVGHAIAFLDHYVKGAPASAALRSRLPGAASFRRD